MSILQHRRLPRFPGGVTVIADVRNFGAIANGASSTGVAAGVDAAVAAGYKKILIPRNCYYLPTGGATPASVEIIGEDWETSVVTRSSPTTEYVSIGAHGKIINCSIIHKFAIDNAAPAATFKHAPVGTAINEADASVIVQNWPYQTLWVGTAQTTNLGGSTATDVPIVGLVNAGTGDNIFAATTDAGVNLRVWPIGSADIGLLVQPGIQNPANIHYGIRIDEEGTNASSVGMQISRVGVGPTSISVTDSLSGSSALSSAAISINATRQSTGILVTIFQSTQAYSGDFYYINAGNSGGTFTGNFCKYTIANVSMFSVNSAGKAIMAGGAVVEAMSAPSAPASGWIIYTDSGDSNKLKAKASNGTVVTLGIP